MYCWIYGMLLQGIYQGGVFVALIINVIPLSCTHNFSKWKVHEQFYEPLGTDLVQLLSSFLFLPQATVGPGGRFSKKSDDSIQPIASDYPFSRTAEISEKILSEGS